MDGSDFIRQRQVCLARSLSAEQVQQACATLRGVKGIRAAESIGSHRLHLEYSLEDLTFELVEALFKELGYPLDRNLFSMLRRGIYQYLEDTALEKLQVEDHEQSLVCDIDEELPHDEPEKYWHKYR